MGGGSLVILFAQFFPSLYFCLVLYLAHFRLRAVCCYVVEDGGVGGGSMEEGEEDVDKERLGSVTFSLQLNQQQQLECVVSTLSRPAAASSSCRTYLAGGGG